jgi:predicted membrane-bound spermidine synthase
MENLIDQLRSFYTLDSSTVIVVVLFCGWAAYMIRNNLTNPASLALIFPLFLFIAFTTYAVAASHALFSPKRMVEWLTYTVFSASIGAIMGISLVAVLRLVQDRFVTMAHIRQSLRRDKEQEERGYPQIDL